MPVKQKPKPKARKRKPDSLPVRVAKSIKRLGTLTREEFVRDAQVIPPIALGPEFSPEVQKLYALCREMTNGGFQLVAFPTMTLVSKERVHGVPQATKAPAQAIGWRAVIVSHRIFHPIKGAEQSAPVAEAQPAKQYQWVTVVDRSFALDALVPVLLGAVKFLRLALFKTTAQGSYV